MFKPLKALNCPNSSDNGLKDINPLTHKEKGCKGLKRASSVKSKQGAIPMLLVAVIVLVLVVGIGYVVVKGIPGVSGKQATTEETEQANSNANKELAKPEQCPTGLLRDNSGACVYPPCPENQARNNEGICMQTKCPSGQTLNANGVCVQSEFSQPNENKECKPSGFIKSAYVRTKGNVGELSQNALGSYPAVATFQFQVTSECKANYYLESGLEQSALTILQPAGSKCDGNNHYAGRFISGDKNTIFNNGGKAGVIDIAFFPLDYGKSQNLKVVAGAYSGCLNDGGITLDEISPTTITYKKGGFGNIIFTPIEITNSWVKVD